MALGQITKAVLALLLLAPQMQVLPGVLDPKKAASSSCSSSAASSVTYDWQFYNTSLTYNSCGTTGGSACTNGANHYSSTDLVAGNVATQTTSTKQPIWTTGEVNSLAADVYTAANDEFFTAASPVVPTGWTHISGFAVLKTSSSSTGSIFGGTPTSTSIYWEALGNHKQQLFVGGTSISYGTAYTANTWYMWWFDWNISSGVYSIGHCASSTCTADASGTTTASYTVAGSSIGYSNSTGGYAGYPIAELAIYNGAANTTCWAQYSHGTFNF